MRITMTMSLAAANEIRFYDACKAAADKLTELADKALAEGDYEQFRGTIHDVIEDNDDAELVGHIRVWQK